MIIDIKDMCIQEGIIYDRNIFEKLRAGLQIAKKNDKDIRYIGPCNLLMPLEEGKDINEICQKSLKSISYGTDTIIYDYLDTVTAFSYKVSKNGDGTLEGTPELKTKIIYLKFPEGMSLKVIMKLSKLKAFL